MCFRSLRVIFVIAVLGWGMGCKSLMSSATSGLASDLSKGVLNQEDPQLVRDGAPAFLLAIDGLIIGDPNNQALLLGGAQLYSAYASAFVEDSARAARLSSKAASFGLRALCLQSSALCEASQQRFDAFQTALGRASKRDLPAMYGYGAAWAGWVQVNAHDWNAVAQLPKVQALMERVVELEPGYEKGGADLYLGVLYCLRPASLGGRPELGRKYFERAIQYSDGENLLAKVLLAEQYARLVFNQPLHDQLLREVVDADPVAPGYTLSNIIAQNRARELLAESDEYF